MVALNSDFAGSKPDTDTKNRVGRFFSLAAETVGEDSRSSRKCAGEKRGYGYDTTSVDTEFEYGAFGELIRATGEKKDDFNFRFSTKYEDTETGLLYYGFRYYDPVTGRWLSRDPIGEAGGLNLYGMVGNDAVNGWDLLGLMSPDECARLRAQLEARLLEAERQAWKNGLYFPGSSGRRSISDYQSNPTFSDAAGRIGLATGALDTLGSLGGMKTGPLSGIGAVTFTIGYGQAVGTAVGEGIYGTEQSYAKARNEVARQAFIFGGSASVGAAMVKTPTPITIGGGLVLIGGEMAISSYMDYVDDKHAIEMRELDEYWDRKDRENLLNGINRLNKDIEAYNQNCTDCE